MTTGEYIRKKRKSLGLTAEELGQMIGKNRATIYRYENNTIDKLPSDILIPLAKALDVSPIDLIQLNQEVVPTTIPNNIIIGQRIKKARLTNKMTLKTLGAKVGLSESTAKRYEDGDIKTVSVNVINRFAIALEVYPQYLLGLTPVPLSDSEQNLVKKFRRLDEIGKDTVTAVIDIQLKRIPEQKGCDTNETVANN